MRNDHYPPGTLQSLLPTDEVTENTRRVLQDRLDKKAVIEPQFFNSAEFVTLSAVCMQLIPQFDNTKLVDLAGELDNKLFENKGDGWRYNKMPEDRIAFKTGLLGINETSEFLFGKLFHLLEAQEKDEVLTAVQTGKAATPTWQMLPPQLFFEELLAAVVEIYYSHPYAKEEIGEVAFADANGWQRISLNELEQREPEAINQLKFQTV